MGHKKINGVILTPLKIISVPKGNVYHVMKEGDFGFCGFGEAYFSSIEFKGIKAWKRHISMTLNLIVIRGKIKFVLFESIQASIKPSHFTEIILGPECNYQRLTIPPNIWMGFQGLSNETSILLNIANIKHDPEEIERLDESMICYQWT